MAPDYSPIVKSVWSSAAEALPWMIGIVVFMFMVAAIEKRFAPKRRRWRGHYRSSERRPLRLIDPKHAPEVTKMQSAAD